MKTLVTGGTGTLGRLVVPRLLAAGYETTEPWQTSPDPAGLAPGSGGPRTSRGCQPHRARSGRRTTNLGGLPGGANELA